MQVEEIEADPGKKKEDQHDQQPKKGDQQNVAFINPESPFRFS
jgi:hypothetical protein